MESTETSDPDHFRDSALFEKCRAMGIIPSADRDLVAPKQPPPVSESPIPDDFDQTLKLSFMVRGMWCPACAWVIEECLRNQTGISEAACHFTTDRVSCRYNPIKTSPAEIMSTVSQLGYETFLAGEDTQASIHKREFIRLAVSAFLTMNIMMLSLALYAGFFTRLSGTAIAQISWPMFLLATAVLVYGGYPIFQRARIGIAAAAPGMEVLIAVGTLSAYFFSIANLLQGGLHLYFDTAAMLITLVLLGKHLEQKALNRVQKDLEGFFSLRPLKVRLCSDQFPQGRFVDIARLKRGDFFRTCENEIISADGIIVAGRGRVEESTLTGEARPLRIKPGDRVKMGTRIVEGNIKIRAEEVGVDALLGQMIQIMEIALSQKTPLEGRADRLLRWFVPIILVLALGTGLVGVLLGLPPPEALIRSVTVLVIACPCALGIAIPLARVAGISLAGRKGILVRDFSAFDQAEKVDTFVFDKTGTMTQGHWQLLKIAPVGTTTAKRLLALAAGLEKDSEHYIALEIRQHAAKQGIQPIEFDRISYLENGMAGWMGETQVKIGSKEFLTQEHPANAELLEKVDSSAEAGHSRVYLSTAGQICGVFIFGDRLRPDSETTVNYLRQHGLGVALVSGDAEQTTRWIGKKIGITTAMGGLLPRDKAEFIQALRDQGHCVGMVGDGANDAPAMASADLAIAVYAGHHLGKEVAHVTLMKGNPVQILDLLPLSKRVTRKVHQNLIWAFAYNIIGIPIAMSGLLNPLLAVGAMLLSSLSVIANTLLLVHFSKASSASNA
ncbi:MAG: cation-translocating P-type ATPase [Desulfobacterales bacterium]